MVTVTDDFTTATDQDLRSRTGWTNRAGDQGFTVFADTDSLGYADSTNAYNSVYYSAATFANDQYAQIQLVAAPSASVANNRSDIYIRGTPDVNYVFAQMRIYDATQMDIIWGSFYDGNFGSYTNLPYSVGDVIRIESVGTNYTIKLNGSTVGTFSDSGHANPSTGGYPGFGGVNLEPSNPIRFDNFEAGDMGGGTIIRGPNRVIRYGNDTSRINIYNGTVSNNCIKVRTLP